jgi:ATP-dependent helicase HrpA
MKLVSLPIDCKKDEILAAVLGNPVVIIEAETGAGKSTRVPQMLLSAGYDVIVTQPRRLAARTVATRVAEECGVPLGGLVGFRTGEDKNSDSAETECLFVTDGLALVRELMGYRKKGSKQLVLVIDEVHEQNINIDVLMAWCKREQSMGATFKIVCMSATMKAKELSQYLNGAPIISVPGRTFPVEHLDSGVSMLQDAVALLEAGRNVLVFQPGKAEILDFVEKLKSHGLDAVILPLYGEMTAEEQGKCFKTYSRPKCVVSTNVAQTSVTIADIDAVIDSGMERRIELVDGVEGLYLRSISKADSAQRRGRAGRTKPGIYIDHCPDDDEFRNEYPVAEILRSRLDQTVLRLAEAHIDAEALEFFHQPDVSEIHAARRSLMVLGCMNEAGQVTAIGHKVARMPVSVQYARMIVEAEERGVLDDVLTIAAILEQRGITERTCRIRQFTQEHQSDCLAQMDVYLAARELDNETKRLYGIHVKRYYDAVKRRKLLADSLRGKVRFGTTGDRDDILRSISVGMLDHIYRGHGLRVRDTTGGTREIARESVCRPSGMVVGIPFDTDRKQLLTMVTNVDLDELIALAPHLLRSEEGVDARYDATSDMVVSNKRRVFNRIQLESEELPDADHPQAAGLFASWVAEQMI